LGKALQVCQEGEWELRVDTGERLTYAFEILQYNSDGSHQTYRSGYETDLLVYDINKAGDWIPRVVVECKSGSVTTHDALTYSTKAFTHKHVHPYLRYGILAPNGFSTIRERFSSSVNKLRMQRIQRGNLKIPVISRFSHGKL